MDRITKSWCTTADKLVEVSMALPNQDLLAPVLIGVSLRRKLLG
jgi:hypothetical protein